MTRQSPAGARLVLTTLAAGQVLMTLDGSVMAVALFGVVALFFTGRIPPAPRRPARRRR